MNSIHTIKPERTCTRVENHYRNFKQDLRDDFNKRCGYCDDLDLYSGGYRNYHIDHFKPHSITRFVALKHDYSNLVYACPFCNIAKSNKWQDNEGFIDPCSEDYDKHIQRCNNGKILYVTESQGKYIWENLKLYLRRHELLWMIDKLKEQCQELNNYLDSLGEEHPSEIEILREFRIIQNEIERYTNLFYEEI